MNADNLYRFGTPPAGPSIFVGPKGSASSLHTDSYGTHFFMLALEGTKRWVMFNHTDADAVLHPGDKSKGGGGLPGMFDQNELCPELNAWTTTDTLSSPPIVALLRPGDILFGE